MILRICHCGHDRDSHFESKHTCLGMLCDCRSYRDRDIPLPKPPPRQKAIAMPAPDDDDDTGDPPPSTQPPSTLRMHPVGCICAACAFMYGVP